MKSKRDNPFLGYVISLSFWEQLTKSALNLLDFQCWAAINKLAVVKPLLFGPYKRFSFNETSDRSWLAMDDVYNVTDWNRYSAMSGLAPLVDRREFLEAAVEVNMKVILVQFRLNLRKLSLPMACKFRERRPVFDQTLECCEKCVYFIRSLFI